MPAPLWSISQAGPPPLLAPIPDAAPLQLAPLTLLTGDAAATSPALTWIWAYGAEMALPNAPGGRDAYPALWSLIDAIAAERGAGAEAAGALIDAGGLIAAHLSHNHARLLGELFGGPAPIWTPHWADGPIGLTAADAQGILDQARRAAGMAGQAAAAVSGLGALAQPGAGRNPLKDWIEFFFLRWLMGGPPPAPPLFLPAQRRKILASFAQFQDALLKRLNDPAGRPPPAPLLDFLYRLNDPVVDAPIAVLPEDPAADALLKRAGAPTLICWEQADAGLSPVAAREVARGLARLVKAGWRIAASVAADSPLTQALTLLAKLGARGGPPPAGLSADELIRPGDLLVEAVALAPTSGAA